MISVSTPARLAAWTAPPPPDSGSPTSEVCGVNVVDRVRRRFPPRAPAPKVPKVKPRVGLRVRARSSEIDSAPDPAP